MGVLRLNVRLVAGGFGDSFVAGVRFVRGEFDRVCMVRVGEVSTF